MSAECSTNSITAMREKNVAQAISVVVDTTFLCFMTSFNRGDDGVVIQTC